MRAGGHGVCPALMPWVAFGETAQGQVTALENTVRGDSFLRIGRAAWVEATVITQKWTQACFVAFDKENEQATH